MAFVKVNKSQWVNIDQIVCIDELPNGAFSLHLEGGLVITIEQLPSALKGVSVGPISGLEVAEADPTPTTKKK